MGNGRVQPAEQQRRERLRLEAAGRFARGNRTGEIARDLRVTPGSVRRWRRAWQQGETARASTGGASGVARLGELTISAGREG